ncbi:hypothetical protein NUM3379_30710 [Kineococcus sp. NUM-3379]
MRRRIAGWPLLLSFGVSSFLALAVVAVVLQHALRGMVEDRAVEEAVRAAEFAAHVGLEPVLPEDARGRVLEGADRRALDAAVASGLGHGVLTRIKIIDPEGFVVYSDDPRAQGRRNQSTPFLRQVVSSGVANHKFADTSGSSHAGERGLGELMEVYVPLRAAGRGPVTVVAELYVPFDERRRTAEQDSTRLAAMLLGGLVFLWLVLYRLVEAASRRLHGELARNEHQALHDALTGLPNRALLFQRTEAVLAGGPGRRAGVLLLDLDRFKEVNDTLGHHVGDRLLVEVAQLLSAELAPVGLREPVTLARLGGDEFAVLVPEVEREEDLELLAHRLVEVLRRPVSLDGVDVSVGASVGVVLAPHDGDSPELLLQRADVAMYTAKRASAPVARYAAEADQYSPERLTMVGELRQALAAGDLELHFQPKAQTSTGEVRGFEALLRWSHPRRGTVPPDVFVPLAESTGLIDEMTLFVVERALEQCAAWAAAGHELSVAVNVSVRNLGDVRFPERVARILRGSGVPASRLVLELTESAFMTDPATAMQVLHALKSVGVGLSIDDYGSGYSSLAYIRELPVDELKIDREFVRWLAERERDRAIVRSTVDLGRNLGLRVVAEGVEDRAAWAVLADAGCEQVQGYFLSRPLPARDVLPWLAGHDAAAVSGRRDAGQHRSGQQVPALASPPAPR